jgi:hypothetical protein
MNVAAKAASQSQRISSSTETSSPQNAISALHGPHARRVPLGDQQRKAVEQ